MDWFARLVIRRRRLIVAIFIIATLVCAALALMVDVNYNMVDYLPESAQSTYAIELMADEFTTGMPNASVMIKDVSITEALEYKKRLKEAEGVEDVMWLDDMVDIKKPLEVQDADTIEGFYKNGNALFTVTIADGSEVTASAALREIIGPENALAGDAVGTAAMQNATGEEVTNAVLILVPAIIILLVLSTTSWIEPVLFLAAIGVSVVINMGTNLIFGEVSFIANSVSPILQLAVSLDYAIFLLHSFADYRKETDDIELAMAKAIKSSMTTVAASALTTLFGFIALIFMEFEIGADLGLCLAKGIVLSFVSVMTFLPALTLAICKLLDRTHHRLLMPSFSNINRLLSKLAVPVVLLVLVAVVPAFMGQSKTDFLYGNGSVDPALAHGRSTLEINEEFGQSTIMALLVPRGDIVKERDLSDELAELEHVSGVMSFASTVGTAIPSDFLDASITEQFYSENYARIIIYTDTSEEGELAFSVVEQITELTGRYYDEFYSAGQSTNLYDMKNVVVKDNSRVNLIAVISIFLVLLITFKSLTLPFILLATIEIGIWVNLSIPYFTGTSINFIGYLVLNTVQLGATVDYAILMTDTFMEKRKLMPLKQAIHEALGSSFKSIIVSAAILSVAGFTLNLTSSNAIVCDIGLLLGRGTLLSLFMVVCFLPTMLRIFDRAIGKTTRGANFYKEPNDVKKESMKA